jgi:arylamine N-acetyltransferase
LLAAIALIIPVTAYVVAVMPILHQVLASGCQQRTSQAIRQACSASPKPRTVLLSDGKGQYRVETQQKVLNDFVPTCWYQQTWPTSHITQGTICSRLTAERCVSISGPTLLRTSGGTKTEERLAEDAALLAAYC